MTKPVLSILIPSIPSRFSILRPLIDKLTRMINGRNIEVLVLTDNKHRSIGAKREVLKNIAQGRYFMFVDDDDDLLSIDELYSAACDNDVDVITFKQQCRNKDGSRFTVTFGLGNPVEHNQNNGVYIDCKRPPFHVCAWNEKFKKFSFGDVSYAEDWVFVKQCLTEAKTEFFIDKIVHSYNFDMNITEASTESNEYWKNPNGKNFPMTKKPEPGESAVVVNLVTNGIERYKKGQDRLNQSLDVYGKGYNKYFFTDESQVGAPKHSENPYAFKIYAIEYARKAGFAEVLWLDASIVAVKPLTPVFEHMRAIGMFMEEAGHYAGSWCNDYTLDYFKITRDQAMKMPMFAAGYVGFDFTSSMAQEFFAEWKESMLNGCFKGLWTDHRHDMTCASIIANLRGYAKHYVSGGKYFAYIGEAYGTPQESVVCHLIGL